MKVDLYKNREKVKFDLSEFTGGSSALNTLNLLMNRSDYRLLYAPQSDWGASRILPDFVGTWLVRLDIHNNPKLEFKSHGTVINSLFNCGIICIDSNKPAPDPRSVLFSLTDEAIENFREIRRELYLRPIERVTKRLVDSICSRYGLSLKYTRAHSLFQIVNDDGSQICKDDFIFKNKKGDPVSVYGDMDLIEWDDILYKFHLLSQERKRTPKPKRLIK